MAAVMRLEIRLEGLGHDLLTAWAPWARDDSDDRHSWSVKPRVARGYHGDPPPEFFVVDKIVAPHRRDRSAYWQVVARYYLAEASPHFIARELGWSEQRVMMNLAAFAELVGREFTDYQELDRERRRGRL